MLPKILTFKKPPVVVRKIKRLSPLKRPKVRDPLESFYKRKTVYDIYKQELKEWNQSLYWQRVFILAKNKVVDEQSFPVVGIRKMKGTEKQEQSLQKVASRKIKIEEEQAPPTVSLRKIKDAEQSTHSGVSRKIKITREKSTSGTVPRKVKITGEKSAAGAVSRKIKIAGEQSLAKLMSQLTIAEEVKDFKYFFEKELCRIYEQCEAKSLVKDRGSGLFLYMDEYTILMLEATEDNIGNVCKHLCKIVNIFFENTRVFKIDDRIKSPYFPRLVVRRAAAVNVNDKFPPQTPTDPVLMGEQHYIIGKKLQDLCETIRDSELQEFVGKVSKRYPMMRLDTTDIPLAPVIFNKLIPEVQRIDMVLECTDFYRNLEEHTRTYVKYPQIRDEDIKDWPLPFNYMPYYMYERTLYDVNLTFPEYVHKEGPAENTSTEQSGIVADFMEREGNAIMEKVAGIVKKIEETGEGTK